MIAYFQSNGNHKPFMNDMWYQSCNHDDNYLDILKFSLAILRLHDR